MSDDRDKLLGIMNSLESDYRSGKISAEKYSYFRSKYEDKLNSIDARDATKRIRSMQGKPSSDTRKRRNKRPTKNKRKQEQDLVQKYIINPKKSDKNYNKKKKSSIDSGTFKLLLLLILVIAFTAGTAYGIFNFDFGSISQGETVAVVDDTAFPEFQENAKVNTTKTYYNYTSYSTSNSANSNLETTSDNSYNQYSQSSNSYSYQSSDSSSQSQGSQSGSYDSGSNGASNVVTTSDGGGN